MGLLNAGCGGGGSSGGGGGGGGDASCTIPSQVTAESAYCPSSPPADPSSFVTVTGTAEYEFRPLDANGFLDNPSTLPKDEIRFAEVQALNSQGSIVSCTETANDGTYSLKVPDDGGTYTIRVNSRGDNSNFRGSVLDAPDTNNFHSVSTTVTGSGSPVANLLAEGRNSIVGGAFNILDQILKSTEFIKTATASCSGISGPSVSCSTFNPQASPGSGKTSKVKAYWKAGFNPNSYFCNGSSGLSFYLPSTDSLFILGGIDNDTDNSDTDHFDNSIIIHEYAHFLEDQYAESDSPGGSHDGNSVLDPRLTWSEGWANYFQAAVRNIAFYTDTSGNKDGTAGLFFHQSTEFRCKNSGVFNSNDSGTCADKPNSAGESNFREFEITRFLWDTTDTNADTFSGQPADNFSMPFSEIWTSFLNLSPTSLAFRSIGNFHEIVNDLTGASLNKTNYNTLATDSSSMAADRSDYANPISSSTSCSTTISSSGSNLFNANDFYDLNHGGGSLTLALTYSPNVSSSDMDLYLYTENHVLFNSSTMAGFSIDAPDSSNPNVPAESPRGSETISISGLAAGRYLIQVNFLAGTNNQTYELKRNGTKICPETSF